jgi:hypothetical protein
MTQLKYLNYLNIKHDYERHNCITIISYIYKEHLSLNTFDTIWKLTNLSNGKITEGRNWMKRFSLQDIEIWASTVARKVNLTELQEYDVILFKSSSSLPTHFGLYVGDNKFLHLEEGKHSKIDRLDERWRALISNAWRPIGLTI